jgi:hypothetical protein
MLNRRIMPADYVPILPALPADTRGAACTSRRTQQGMRPLFVIVKSRSRTTEEKPHFVVQAAERIVKSWRLKGSPFIELYDEPDPSDPGWWPHDHTLILLHRFFRSQDIWAIPVIATDRSGPYLEAFTEVVKSNQSGLCVRLYDDDLELPQESINRIGQIATGSGCTNAEIDIIIDLKRILPARQAHLRTAVLDFLSALDLEQPFRSIVLAGSSVPIDLSGIPENGTRDVPRYEYRLWQEIRSARGARRFPALGDYGTVRPEYDDRRGSHKHLNGKLLYTCEGATRVFRGESRAKRKLHLQYADIAKRVARDAVFSGMSCSWGDEQIANAARTRSASGDPATWVAYSTSHHLDFVCSQAMKEIAQSVT